MRALILGGFGQDGYYLTHHLQAADWSVCATGRQVPQHHELPAGTHTKVLDVRDAHGFRLLLEEFRPDVVFNLAAVSSVAYSWQQPIETLHTNGTAVYDLLETVRHHSDAFGSNLRFIQCTSSEAFGGSDASFVTPTTSPRGVSPYGLSKSVAHEAVRIHRLAYGTFAANAILYNHESPRRPLSYLTRRISGGVARIRQGWTDHLTLQTLDVVRDWGHADDYCRALMAMSQVPEPRDFVIASGEQTPLTAMLQEAFSSAGLDDWHRYVRVSRDSQRPVQPNPPPADVSATWPVLAIGTRRSALEVICEMVHADIALLQGA